MNGTDEPPQTDPRGEAATLIDGQRTGPSPENGSPETTISRYLVIEKLGAGAMGVVLRGYDPRLRREVALKLLHRREDPGAEARMLREAQSMAQLSHPNVVAIYDAETTDQGVMIAMELVVGLPLDRWLDEQPRSYQQVLAAFIQAGQGLAAAHAAGIIHRDFKPANVFVGNDDDPQGVGRVRVGDFGLARETSQVLDHAPPPDAPSSVDLTATGAIMGTPVYMAPEQHLGLAADERSDQFAFCVSLWEAIHGERPFGGEGVFALGYAKQHGDLRPPRTKIPAAIQAAIQRGLSTKPDDRWPDLTTLLERIEPRRRRRGVLALAGTVIAATIATAAVVTADTRSPREARCAAALEQLAATWNDDTRATLEAEERAPPRLFEALDSYATRLQEQYTHTCEATPPLDDLDFDVTMSCLDSRTRRVGATVEILSTGTVHEAKLVDKTIDSLTAIDRCAETRWSGTGQILPDDPQEREVVLRLRDDIAQVRRLEEEGRQIEAIPLADVALAQAEASGFVPIVANALVIRSSLAKFEDRDDYAAELLRRALELRLSIGDHVEGVAAAVNLVHVRGVRQDRYEEADGWAAVARGLMGNTDIGPIRRGWLYNHVGASMNTRGEPEAAIEPLRHAVTELTTGLGPDHPSVADPLSHLANALTKLGRAEEALEPARRAMKLREAKYPPGSPAITAAALNLAQALSRTGAHEEALHSLRQALEPLEAQPAAAARRVQIWRHIAEVHERAGDAAAAVEAHARVEALEHGASDASAGTDSKAPQAP